MDDDLMSRRRKAAAVFTARRGELGLTQEQVAAKAGIAVRTVQSLESATRMRWPNPMTRARLDRAVGWPEGELDRLAAPPRAYIDPQLLDRVSQLTPEQREWMIGWLQGRRDEEPGRSRQRGE